MADDGTVAGIVLFDDIDKCGIGEQPDVEKLPDLRQQMAGNFLTGDILVKEDALVGMCPFLREGKAAILIPGKIDTLA